jgi:hypothetical protein
MRLRAIHGRWSPYSEGVFLCLFLAMVVFIAFEVLDLDGSNLQGLSAVAIAAESAPTDLEKLLPSSHSVPESQSRVPACLDHRLPPEAINHLSPLDGKSLLARLDQTRPRSCLRRETQSTVSRSDDPA